MNLGERVRDYLSPRQRVETSPRVADEVKCTTCYMCACRCGIKVHLKDGGIRYIEGNRDHPVNRGVICGKGASGIMQQYSPAKLRKPLRRVGERGSGEFREIEWAEAIATAVDWLSPIRDSDPKKLAFFTGRDQSQSLTGFWAAQFGTPNFAAHGGFCSVNMAAAGMYTLGSDRGSAPAGGSNRPGRRPQRRVVEQRQRSPNSRCGPVYRDELRAASAQAR